MFLSTGANENLNSSTDQLLTLMLGLADIEASYITIDNMLNMETRFKVQN